MNDIVERAEKALLHNPTPQGSPERLLICDLIAALKAAREQRYNANTLSEGVIAHVLADIDQVSNEDQWSLRERLESIQKICDGSEYTHD